MASHIENFKELERPIIFIGNPRSGTTIISEIVMRHKDIGYPSQYQNAFPRSTTVNYLRRVFDNKYWRIFGQKKQLNKVNPFNRFVFRTGENYTMWKAIVGPGIDFDRDFLHDKREQPEYVRKIRKFFSKIVRNQGKKRLAFKITGPSRLEYLNSIFPDAQYVRIHRKAIPTVSSLMKIDFWPDRGEKRLWWTGPYTQEELDWAEKHKDDPIALTAFQIKKVSDVTDEEVRKLNVDVLDVQYIDFVRNPEEVIKQILDHTHLSYDDACLDYMKRNKIFNRNKKDEDYFPTKDLETIRQIYPA